MVYIKNMQSGYQWKDYSSSTIMSQNIGNNANLGEQFSNLKLQ